VKITVQRVDIGDGPPRVALARGERGEAVPYSFRVIKDNDGDVEYVWIPTSKASDYINLPMYERSAMTDGIDAMLVVGLFAAFKLPPRVTEIRVYLDTTLHGERLGKFAYGMVAWQEP